MIIPYDFGKRRKVPCFDCDERGHCTMNCGPDVICSKRLKLEAEKAKKSVRPKGGGRSA